MKKLKILFNLEGNNKIGMGHIYECLRLGNKFKEVYSPEILYLISSESDTGIKKISNSGYNFKIIEKNDIHTYIDTIKKFKPNVVINDILNINEGYLEKLTKLKTLIVNIEHIRDPLSLNYAHIIFNSLYPEQGNFKGDYYYGPKYISLEDSFKNLSKKEIKKNCKNFFVCFGGSDYKGYSIKTIKSLNNLNGIHVNVLLGASFQYDEEIKSLSKKIDKNKFSILRDVPNTLEYILNADIGLVSGGHTLCELSATGTPGILFSHNKMEKDRAKLFSNYYGLCLNLDDAEKMNANELLDKIKDFMGDFGLRKKISEQGQNLVDGYGSERIVNIIIEKLKCL